MTLRLYPFQRDLVDTVYTAWGNGARNVAMQLECRAGKTVCFGTILHDSKEPSIAIAHRRELIGQMSLTLARLEVRHRIIAPDSTIREIVALHMREIGKSWFDANSQCAAASVHTLVNRDLGDWARRVKLWVTDEAHHLLAGNVWGKATALFPNARGLGVTATPLRADGKGLGRHADGLMDVLVTGPPSRSLIDAGYLTDYRIFAPPSDFDTSEIPVTGSGDYSPPALAAAAKRSHIVGDVVEHYLRIAPGKLGITFAVSVELAAETAARFRAAGVPAEMVSADTPVLVRAEIMRRFARRELLQLVNVDLFGEGFDLPALEVVSMGRPTHSYPLYHQQFMRACSLLEGKDRAIVIDHVGNVRRHGLPDAPRAWTLDRRERRGRSADVPIEAIRVCAACTAVYERAKPACPYCGHVPVPAERSSPAHVDGDLFEIDPGVLARLRGQVAAVDGPPSIPFGATAVVRGGILNRHRKTVEIRNALRGLIAWYGGWQRSLGRDDAEGYRRFYVGYGVDVLTAQTLGRAETETLTERIRAELVGAGVQMGTEIKS